MKLINNHLTGKNIILYNTHTNVVMYKETCGKHGPCETPNKDVDRSKIKWIDSNIKQILDNYTITLNTSFSTITLSTSLFIQLLYPSCFLDH